MNIELKRNMQINSCSVIATIDVYESSRDDIRLLIRALSEKGVEEKTIMQVLTNEMADCDEQRIAILAQRIYQYLIDIHMIANNELTFHAKNILKTDMFQVRERGKFRIWVIDDPLLEKQIIHYDRVQPLLKSKVESLAADEFGLLQMEKKKYKSVISQKDFYLYMFDRINTNIIPIQKDYHESNALLSWRLDNTKNNISELELSGRLNFGQSFSGSELYTRKEMNGYEKFMMSLINENSDYQMDIRRKAIRIRDISECTDEELLTFKKNIPLINIECEFGAFENTVAFDVLIMPDEWRVANQWAERYLEMRIADSYTDELRFNEIADTVIHNTYFSEFRDRVIEQLNMRYFLDKYLKDKKYDEYWSLQAPLDLNCNIQKHVVIDRIDIPNGEKLSMRQLVLKILKNNRPQKLFFASKYILDKRQIRKFELFADSFFSINAECNIELVGNDRVVLQDRRISQTLIREIITAYGRIPHDRYFAFMIENEWMFYKMSAELDQIYYEEPNVEAWNCDFIGDWKDISIMRIDESVFPKEYHSFVLQNM